jgi:RHS repeat-associated protein
MNQPGYGRAQPSPSSASQTDPTGQASFQISAPTISLPKGGGAIRSLGEKFAANPVTGTGTMTIPIATSPGRSGFGPRLSLTYDSGAGNGAFGLGWNLFIPAITRKTDKGIPQYRDAEESDVFILSGAEDLVPVLVRDSSGNWAPESIPPRIVNGETYRIHRYRPRIEGLFARIERWVNETDPRDTFWRSISRDNVTTWYGRTPESRIADAADPSHVFTWLICESYDDKGNAIGYEYKKENSDDIDVSLIHEVHRTPDSRKANRYLKHVRYGNHDPYFPQFTTNDPWPTPAGNSGWYFEVVFDYGEHDASTPAPGGETVTWLRRNDPFSTYRPGFEVRTYRLCQRVLMFHHFPQETDIGSDCLVRSTDFTYSFEENPADAHNPIFSILLSVTQSGYKRRAGGYLRKSLPPVEFRYSEAIIDSTVHDVDAESVENLPYGFEGGSYQWIDLEGEGLSGILTEQAQGWFYKRNISPLNFVANDGGVQTQAKFAPVELVSSKPNAAISAGQAQFMDLAGDGVPDLVLLDSPTPGFYEKDNNKTWNAFRAFTSGLHHSIADPNLKLVDLDGDGIADVLITGDDAITWHGSLGENGFGPGQRIPKPRDEERGPAIVFADGTQSIYLGDMSGDGLSDLIRIRNGEVCYWPNLGYGRFGAKVTMDNSPWFDRPDLFNQRRVRLADIDGSGVTDILYLHADGVRIYFNQSGNSWSAPTTLPAFPPIDDLAFVSVVDLLGNGTACLVWSSTLPSDVERPMRYIDLMGGQKPHLLVTTVNNYGAETHVRYASSTRFYLQDERDGYPWITRLPFPVQVVERVETLDQISRNRFVTRYTYHHGYFDGIEREFRGFGMIEQFDTEELAALTQTGHLPDAVNIDGASYVPTVMSKTWFHSGAYIEGAKISRHFEDEYYRESGLSSAQLESMLLPDTKLPEGPLTPDELREACRALKGSVLRREIYALDGSNRQELPYAVTEQNYTIELLQPRSGNKYSVFFVHPRESISFHYERVMIDAAGGKIADPRVIHSMALEVDAFGNVLKSASISYGRRPGLSPLQGKDRLLQEQTNVTCIENGLTNAVLEPDAYRHPMPAQARTYELIQVMPDQTQPSITNLFRLHELLEKLIQAGDGAHDLPYEDIDGAGATTNHPYRRLIEQVRVLYRPDDLGTSANDPLVLLPMGTVQSRALSGETYKLAFTPGLLAQVFQRNGQPLLANLADVMQANGADSGGYIELDGDGHWWISSGRMFLSPWANDLAAEELDFARQHFYLPRRYRNPFHTAQNPTESVVTLDAYDLLLIESRDALGNNPRAVGDYRVLSMRAVTDANGNQSEVAFDALGMVVGGAVMGKFTEQFGDSLDNFVADLDDSTVEAHLVNPFLDPHAILQRASTRVVYDLFAFYRTKHQPDPQPAVIYTLIRETHDADLGSGEETNIQHSFRYSDGFGREIQSKFQAEPGPAPERGADGKIIIGPDGAPVMTANSIDHRWASGGWTVFNNKGQPVRKYEPFFSDAQRFEFDVRVGVSPIVFYDPLGRIVAKLHPNHAWEKIRLDPWRQEVWDLNDTVLLDPANDDDVNHFFLRLPNEDYLPTWFAQRAGGDLGVEEQDAANKTAVHAATPSVTHADSLGRAIVSVAQNRFERNNVLQEETYSSRIEFDIQSNQRAVRDAMDRIVTRFDYDMLGAAIHQSSMEAGQRWMLSDVSGNLIRAWDSRDHQFRSAYDALRRPLNGFVQEGSQPEILVWRKVYGEELPGPETQNQRGKVVQLFDQTGVLVAEHYDFKGNLLETRRQLAGAYRSPLNWSANPGLEADTFVETSAYDALNRPLSGTTPDGSVYRPTFNEANLLETVSVNLRGAPLSTPFLTNIDYDAKGRRVLCEHRNNVSTEYQYDRLAYHLSRLTTTRNAGPLVFQDLSYTYDAAGNITQIRDEAQQTIYFNNQAVEPDNAYTYDATYRLIKATGREHIGQISHPETTWDDRFRVHLPHPGDGQAMRRFTEHYEYDAAGNVQRLVHQAANAHWTRTFSFNETSSLEATKTSNRLSSTTVGAGSPEVYVYDAHGNMTAMPHLTDIRWDFRDALQSTSRQSVTDGAGETTFYVYDANGGRVRKVTERQNGTRKNERRYLGGFEIYREYGSDGTTVTLERQTLHVMDDEQRIALIDTKTVDADIPAFSSQALIRYQFHNHLGSGSLELDDAAQVISYEEYFPFGSTSYQGVSNDISVNPRRYRYAGMERDDETGLNYHTLRYYAPWLCRWTSPDPLGIRDSLNAFAAFHDNPIAFTDSSGSENVPSNFVEYADSVEGGLYRIMELGLEKHKEFGLALDEGTGKLMILEGSSGSVHFWKLIPLGHTHTGADKGSGPSTADLDEFARKNVKEHWIFGENDGWRRLRYDPATKSFDVAANDGGKVIVSRIVRNRSADPNDDSPIGRANRWKTVEENVGGYYKLEPPKPSGGGSGGGGGRGGGSTEGGGKGGASEGKGSTSGGRKAKGGGKSESSEAEPGKASAGMLAGVAINIIFGLIMINGGLKEENTAAKIGGVTGGSLLAGGSLAQLAGIVFKSPTLLQVGEVTTTAGHIVIKPVIAYQAWGELKSDDPATNLEGMVDMGSVALGELAYLSLYMKIFGPPAAEAASETFHRATPRDMGEITGYSGASWFW